MRKRDDLNELNNKHKLNTTSTELDFLNQIKDHFCNLEKMEEKYLSVQRQASVAYLANIKSKRLRVEQMIKETCSMRLSVLAEGLVSKNEL